MTKKTSGKKKWKQNTKPNHTNNQKNSTIPLNKTKKNPNKPKNPNKTLQNENILKMKDSELWNKKILEDKYCFPDKLEQSRLRHSMLNLMGLEKSHAVDNYKNER